MYGCVTRNCRYLVKICVKKPSRISWSTPSRLLSANIYTDSKMVDAAFPNNNWLKEAVDLFNRLNEMGDDWKKVVRNVSVGADGSKSFLNSDMDGKLFAYAFFHNKKLDCMKAVVQFGLYSRGPPGIVHGGAIATILDVAMGNCAHYSGYTVVTANLNVDYKRPIPLNTATLVEAKIDNVEGRKVFISGAIKNVDGDFIYSTATSVFIQFNKL